MHEHHLHFLLSDLNLQAIEILQLSPHIVLFALAHLALNTIQYDQNNTDYDRVGNS